MVAFISVDPSANMSAIAEAAGQLEETLRWYENGNLFVSGVSQQALEGAYAAYDHSQTIARQQREQFKRTRADAVARIEVTTSASNTFDGDEVSQGRMARAIACMVEADSVPWVLANNSVIQASRGELIEALRMAGACQSELWAQG